MEGSWGNRIVKCIFIYAIFGIIFLIVDEVGKIFREREVKVTLWKPKYENVYLKDTQKIERLWETINKYRKVSKVIWFSLSLGLNYDCILEVYDYKEEVRAQVCKSEDGWFLEYDTSARKSPSHYRLSEGEAQKLIKKILSIARGSNFPKKN